MATMLDKKTGKSVMNIPNQLTVARLVLSLMVFTLLSSGYYLASFICFIIAASTDWVDGYYARRYGQVTQLGRILDPFADKIIICGTFILLAVEMKTIPWGIRGWMAVVVVAREMLVTGLRSFIERAGADFSAKMSGKLKMVFQCIAVGAGFVALIYQQPLPAWVAWSLGISVWLAVLSTIYSGVVYLIAAARFLRADVAGT